MIAIILVTIMRTEIQSNNVYCIFLRQVGLLASVCEQHSRCLELGFSGINSVSSPIFPKLDETCTLSRCEHPTH